MKQKRGEGHQVTPAFAALVLKEAQIADAAELDLYAEIERLAKAGESERIAEIAAMRRTAAAIDVLGRLARGSGGMRRDRG